MTAPIETSMPPTSRTQNWAAATAASGSASSSTL